MEENINDISSRELIEMYNKNQEFIDFLESEQKKAERMRDEK